MATHTNLCNMPYTPTDAADFYPERDGEPIAASDFHLEILIWLLQVLKAHFSQMPDVYVSGDILTYYTAESRSRSRTPPRTTCTLTSTHLRRNHHSPLEKIEQKYSDEWLFIVDCEISEGNGV